MQFSVTLNINVTPPIQERTELPTNFSDNPCVGVVVDKYQMISDPN